MIISSFRARIIAGAAAVALCAAAGAANATTYVLHNARFDDGTTATGTFSTNSYGWIDAWNIQTSDGFITGNTYTPTINPGYAPGDTVVTFNRPDYLGFLQLTLSTPLTSSGVIPLIVGPGGPSYECDTWSCPGPSFDVRYLAASRDGIGGFLAAIPEPGAWVMMIGGLGLIGAAARRRRSAAACAA